MTTSGTYAFAPNLGDVTLQAFSRCRIRRSALEAEHLLDAKNEANYVQIEFANRGVNLWTVDDQTVALVSNTATYSIDPATVMVLEVFCTNAQGTDRIVSPLNRTDYFSIPKKDQSAPPTSYWFDRQVAPQITFWPVPDGTDVSFTYTRYRQMQDAALTGGLSPEMQYLFLDAFVWKLAERMAVIYAPDLVDRLSMKAEMSYQYAAEQNTEFAPMYISPQLASYYRR